MNNLTGQIPESLGFLTRLEVLDLSENDLFGNVPLSIFNVSSLKLIDLARNYELRGTLTNEICSKLPVLQYISMANNQLAGELPSGLDKCAQLEVLSLSYNGFTGNLPRDVWNMSTVQDMFLGWNNLTGIIPSEIQNLPAIQRLSLRRNDLVGTLPPSLGNLSTLMMIDIGANNLHGNIPKEFAKLVNLGSNKISGQIPSSFYNNSGLEIIALTATRFLELCLLTLAIGFPILMAFILDLTNLVGRFLAPFLIPPSSFTLILAAICLLGMYRGILEIYSSLK